MKAKSCLPKYICEGLQFEVLAKCSTSKARISKLVLPHSTVETPVFMPVGTQATLKGILPEQLESLDCHIMLSNTYHLGNRPGSDLVAKAGGVHEFMGWKRSVLTDSGGFQMVSLSKLSTVSEEGVTFQSPYDGSTMLMTPEKSIAIQTELGADIIMQLDDVVHVLTTGERVEEAMWRTLRWLDRCIAAHKNTAQQNLFGIVQVKKCCEEMTKRDLPGFAIGGLSGGEEKSVFWRMVKLSADNLPENKPRYCMGIGYAVDLVVCSALGVDMYDCVYPTRTARFGTALVSSGGGVLKLTNESFKYDFTPIDESCPCSTCRNFTRAFLNSIATNEPIASTLISIHNVCYQLRLMQSVREAILEDKFPEFVTNFMNEQFPDKKFPQWVVDALESVNISLQ